MLENLNITKESAVESTRLFEAEFYGLPDSPQQQAIVRAFDACDFGCQVENVRRLIMAVTGVPLKSTRGLELRFSMGVVVVPLGNSNSHNYRIGVPCICVDPVANYFLQNTGIVGNHMTDVASDLCAATKEEIETFWTLLELAEKEISLIPHHGYESSSS